MSSSSTTLPSSSSSSSPRVPPKRTSFFQWVPTDDDQLQASEHVLLEPLFKLGFEQYTSCGLNSISLRVNGVHNNTELKNLPLLDVDDTNSRKHKNTANAQSEDDVGDDENKRVASNQKKVILNHVVWIHGFGGGIGTWLPNFKPLGEDFNKRNEQEQENREDADGNPQNFWLLHAIDNPGFARSKREEIEFKDANHVIDYYTKSFEDWFEASDFGNATRWILNKSKSKINYQVVSHKITLVAHSFGSFLAGHFTVRNSQRFSIVNLFLVDPWGVGIFDEKNPEHTFESFDWKRRFLIKSVLSSTEGLLSPVLRFLGPYAPGIIEKFRPDFIRRFSDVGLHDPKAIIDYIFHCNAKSECVGDKAFRKGVQGRNYAIVPLMSVIPEKLDAKVRMSIVYGEKTWMRKNEGFDMFESRKKQLLEVIENDEEEQQKAASNVGQIQLISEAGHQVCSDNPQEFNEFLLKEVLQFNRKM